MCNKKCETCQNYDNSSGYGDSCELTGDVTEWDSVCSDWEETDDMCRDCVNFGSDSPGTNKCDLTDEETEWNDTCDSWEGY